MRNMIRTALPSYQLPQAPDVVFDMETPHLMKARAGNVIAVVTEEAGDGRPWWKIEFGLDGAYLQTIYRNIEPGMLIRDAEPIVSFLVHGVWYQHAREEAHRQARIGAESHSILHVTKAEYDALVEHLVGRVIKDLKANADLADDIPPPAAEDVT